APGRLTSRRSLAGDHRSPAFRAGGVGPPRLDRHPAWRRRDHGEGRSNELNRDILKGQWTQIKGKVREQWGKLTSDDIDQMQGHYEQLGGKVQERYGRSREQAEQEVNRWLDQHGHEHERKAS